MRLFDNFEEFCEEWYLDCYDDFKDSIDKKKELHSHFRICIQSLIGLAGVREKYVLQKWPTSGKEMLLMYPHMVQFCGENVIAECLSCNWFIPSDINWSFPQVNDPYLFLFELCNL